MALLALRLDAFPLTTCNKAPSITTVSGLRRHARSDPRADITSPLGVLHHPARLFFRRLIHGVLADNGNTRVDGRVLYDAELGRVAAILVPATTEKVPVASTPPFLPVILPAAAHSK